MSRDKLIAAYFSKEAQNTSLGGTVADWATQAQRVTRDFIQANPEVQYGLKGLGVGIGGTGILALAHAIRRQREEENRVRKDRKKNLLSVQLPPKQGSWGVAWEEDARGKDVYTQWLTGALGVGLGALGTKKLYRTLVKRQLDREEEEARNKLIQEITQHKGAGYKEATAPLAARAWATLLAALTLGTGGVAYATKRHLDSELATPKPYDIPPTYKIQLTRPPAAQDEVREDEDEAAEVAKAALVVAMDSLDDAPRVLIDSSVKAAAALGCVDTSTWMDLAQSDVSTLYAKLAAAPVLRSVLIKRARAINPMYRLFVSA